VAFTLWRWKGLGIWVAGIVWLSLSFFDFLDGLTTTITFGAPTNLAISSAAAIAWFIAWLVVDVIAIGLLIGKSVRSRYLGAQ
jgi:hypothetical protein